MYLQTRLSLLIFGIFFASIPFVSLAQTPYAVSVRTEPFQPLPIGGGTMTTHNWSSSDEGSVSIQLPFTVRFFDEEKSQLFLSTNMFASWQTTNAYSNTTLPSSGTPNDLMAVWWDDNTCDSHPLKTQILGTAPSRIFVAEWNCRRLGGSSTDNIQAQLWLYENSSTIEFRYGQFNSSGSISATMGIENADGSIGYNVPSAATGNTCGNSCTQTDWHTNGVVTFSQGPELRVTAVESVAEGFAGLFVPISATVQNVGGKPAENFTVRFYINSVPQLTSDAIELATLDGDLRTLQPMEPPTTFETRVRLPITLEEGVWYLLAEADPYRVVPESNRGDNVGVFGPFVIGIRAANLVVDWVDAPDLAAPGEDILVRWSASNRGNLDATLVNYRVVLHSTSFPTPVARELGTGGIPDLPMDARWVEETTVRLPADLEPGVYFVGVELDPERGVFEHERSDNYLASNPVVVSAENLVIVTDELPVAEFGGHYHVRLLAVGGDGTYDWGVKEGSTLPPGLRLKEELGQNGMATFLEGVPSHVGHFEFDLEVWSAGYRAEKHLVLEVEEPGTELRIVTGNLAEGAFGFPYEDRLMAIGGVPPYTWELAKGRLPAGVTLRSDGVLSGRPEQDGTFTFTVRVRDDEGRQAAEDLELHVASPSTLTCVTRRLEPLAFGESVQIQLHAAGGQRDAQGGYLWTSVDTAWLATEIGEETTYRKEPPPGLQLTDDGVITGKPSAFGSFLWTVNVRDATGSEVPCSVRFDVPRDRGLTVVTRRLPTAVAGRSYRTQLEASGGDGQLMWSEYGGSRVLDELGLSFDATGSLSGTIPLSVLQGESEREFTLTMRVKDEYNRIGVGVVTLTVREPGANDVKTVADEGGCQAGSGTATPWALALLCLALLRRRR